MTIYPALNGSNANAWFCWLYRTDNLQHIEFLSPVATHCISYGLFPIFKDVRCPEMQSECGQVLHRGEHRAGSGHGPGVKGFIKGFIIAGTFIASFPCPLSR